MVEDFSNRKTSNAKMAVLKNAIKIARILHFIKRVFNSLHTEWQRTHHTHHFQAPQMLPRKLDRAAENVWDEVEKRSMLI